jgi:outer membrane protein assembly factor BamB
MAWQLPIPSWGSSTPVIWGNALFLTTQEDCKKLLLLKIDKRSGKIEWTREIGVDPAPENADQLSRPKARRNQWLVYSHGVTDAQNYASPSPVTNGKVVVAHFGNGDLVAYDFDGKLLWRHNLQDDYGAYTVWWGHSNSPVIYNDLVINICVQDSCDDMPGDPSPNYVVAHDLMTGKERWKTDRRPAVHDEPGDSYTTPIFFKNGEQLELVVFGGLMLDAYNPKDGSRLWNLPGLVGNRTITGPVAAHNMIYATQGMRQPLLAVRPSAKGELPQKDIVWQSNKDTPDATTPVVWEKWLFLVNNNGTLRCLDAVTGEQKWKERLKGDFRASPLAADGRIYIMNGTGQTTVIAASPEFKKLAENTIDDRTVASPIVSDGHIYLRGNKKLYCVGK